MWLRGPIRDGAIKIKPLVNFAGGVKAIFAEPWADVWYVDGENGNDRNSGRGQNKAKKLISVAEAAAKDNDVVYLKAGDHTMAAKLTWDLNDARLIGLSPIPMQPHLDIWQQALTSFNPMIEVSGKGNIFANMTFRHGAEYSSGVGYATDLTCLKVSGRYNYFENVYFYTPIYHEQHVANGPVTNDGGYAGVEITGHNNYFRGCKFGGDGCDRDTLSFNLAIRNGIGNIFEDCIFQMAVDGTTPLFLHINSASRDMKLTQFLNCKFYAHSAAYTVSPADAFSQHAGGGTAGVFFDSRCQFINVDNICPTGVQDDWIWIPVTSKDGAADTAYKELIALRGQGV